MKRTNNMEKKNEWCQEMPWYSEAWVRLASPFKTHDQIIGEIVAEAERRKEREVWSEISEWIQDEKRLISDKKEGMPHVCPIFIDSFVEFINSRLASLEE